MNKVEIARWTVGVIFWVLSLMVLIFNIKRQFSDQNISGIPFLFTIFTVLGIAASPFKLYWPILPALLFEIPALVNFRPRQ